jgi:hypothetical protein
MDRPDAVGGLSTWPQERSEVAGLAPTLERLLIAMGRFSAHHGTLVSPPHPIGDLILNVPTRLCEEQLHASPSLPIAGLTLADRFASLFGPAVYPTGGDGDGGRKRRS